MSTRRLVLSLDEGDVRALYAAVTAFELGVHAAQGAIAGILGVKRPARLGEGKGDTSTRLRELRGTFERWLQGDG